MSTVEYVRLSHGREQDHQNEIQGLKEVRRRSDFSLTVQRNRTLADNIDAERVKHRHEVVEVRDFLIPSTHSADWIEQ